MFCDFFRQAILRLLIQRIITDDAGWVRHHNKGFAGSISGMS